MILAARNTCLITWSRLFAAPSRHHESSSPSASEAFGRSWGGGEWESPKKDITIPGGEWDSVGGELNWYCRPWSEGRMPWENDFPAKMKTNETVNVKIDDDLTRFKGRAMWGREFFFFFMCIFLFKLCRWCWWAQTTPFVMWVHKWLGVTYHHQVTNS